MSGSTRLIDERPRQLMLSRRSRWKLEASFWAGLLVIAWELTPFRFIVTPDLAPLAEWVALGLAGVATVTALQVKRRLRRKLELEQAEKTIRAPNPLSLIQLLREHGVREFGAMYLYMPMPKRPGDRAAWAWIETLHDEELIKGQPWQIKAHNVKESVRQSHPGLFVDDVEYFDVYRLDWQTLNKVMGDALT